MENDYFWCFWLTIQNTTTSQARSLFRVIAVLISFPLARCAPPPHLPPFLGEGSTKKRKSPVVSGLAFGHVCIGLGVVSGALGGSRLCYYLFIFDEKKAQSLAVRPRFTRFTCESIFCALLA
jgi:hypothetical protein